MDEHMDFEYKQVIIVRQDLGMTKGKIAVQVAHGAVSAAERARVDWPKWFTAWFQEGQKKVVAKISNLPDLFKYREEARSHHLPFALIEDAGLTELPPGTVTVLAIGPGPASEIDRVTGDLKLL